MNTHKLIITLLFFATAVFTACNPDECKNREYLPAFPNVVNNIPYQDGQVVRFKTNAGDTVKTFVKHLLEIVRPDYPEVCEEVLTITLKEPGKPYPYISFLTRGSVTDLKNIIQMDIPMSTNGTSGGYIRWSAVRKRSRAQPGSTGTQKNHPDILQCHNRG